MTFFEHINGVNPFDSSHKCFCLPTDFKPLDDIIGGIACGCLTTIAGLPGARHDNFLYSMLVNWVKSDANLSVLFINLRGYRYSHLQIRC